MVTYSKLKFNHNYENIKIMEKFDKTINLIKTDSQKLHNSDYDQDDLMNSSQLAEIIPFKNK